MKKYTKILIGLSALLVAASVFYFIPQKVAAQASSADAQACEKSLKFVDFANIQCTTPQGVVTFTDDNPNDDQFNFDYSQDASSVFCMNLPGRDETALQRGVSREGGNLIPSDAGKPVKVTLNLGVTTNGTNCVRYGGSEGKNATISDTQGLRYLYQFQGTSIVPLDGVNQGALSKDSWGLVDDYNSGTLDLNVIAFTDGDYTNCSGSIMIVKTSEGATSAPATLFGLKKSSSGFDKNKYPDLYDLLTAANVTGCGVLVSPNDIPPRGAEFGILGIPPEVAPPGSKNPGGGGVTRPENSCEGNNNSNLEFILCGVLRTIDKMVSKMTGVLEDLLNFDTNKYLNQDVHNAWGIFKNLATVLLVIIMLIMVISQALSIGPVDAYTLRKLLPKLVAAVIIMQISWYLLIWTIGLANDAGQAVANLMAAPFGGTDNLNLDKLIGQIGKAAPGITDATLFGTLAGYALFSGLTIFGWAFLAVSAFLAMILGFFLLLIRQLLIILAVIMVPIALIMWILPGTQRYWKLWTDTFIKLLILFPLIMAIIYAGRIFAHVAGQVPSASTLQAPALPIVATLAILIGYFGPYFLLPKALTWGGQLYGAAANAAIKGTSKARGFPGRYALGKAKENREQRAVLRATRLAEDPNNRRFTDRLLAGEFNYTRERGRGGRLGAREMQFARTLGEGEKANRESVPARLLSTGYDSWRHGPATNERGERIREGEAGYETNKLDANQAWLEGRTYAGIAPDAALSGHAFDTLATLGDPDRLREARESGHVSEEVWSKAVARNFPKLNEIARYLTLAPDLSNLSPRQFTTQDDDTAQELERQLSGNYIHNRETGGRTDLTEPQHREALQRAADLAVEARNPLIWTDLGQAKRRVVENIEAMAAAEGLAGREGRLRPDEPPEEPAPPPPPPPPGPEDDEGEIRIDR